jgi:hypothetical protein
MAVAPYRERQIGLTITLPHSDDATRGKSTLQDQLTVQFCALCTHPSKGFHWKFQCQASLVINTYPIMRGKSNKNVPPAAPGRPFRNIFGGIEFAPPAPPRGRPPSVFKRYVAEPATLGKRSRTGLSPSFRKRTGTGDTSVSPVIIDWDVDNVTDENVDSATGVREPTGSGI